MKIVKLFSYNILYSVGDDRSLRVWKNLKFDHKINNIFFSYEYYAHGARVLCLEVGKKTFVFTGAADQSICIWKWDNVNKLNTLDNNLLLVKKLILDNCGSIRSFLMIEKNLVIIYFY